MKASNNLCHRTLISAVTRSLPRFSIIALALSMGLAHATVGDGIEATTDTLIPTPTDAIAQGITENVQNLSLVIGQGSGSMQDARASLGKCNLDLKASAADNSAFARNTECLVGGYDKAKQSLQLVKDGFATFGKDLGEKYRALGVARQEQRKALEDTAQEQRKHEDALEKTERRIRKLAEQTAGTDGTLDRKVRREAMRLYFEHNQLSVRKRIVDDRAVKLAEIDKKYETAMQNVADWRDSAEDNAYNIGLQIGTLDVLLESAVTIGVATAGIVDWSGAASALSDLDGVWQKMGPVMAAINNLAGTGIPLPDGDGLAMASPNQNMDDHALIAWLNRFRNDKE